VVCNVQKTLTI